MHPSDGMTRRRSSPSFFDRPRHPEPSVPTIVLCEGEWDLVGVHRDPNDPEESAALDFDPISDSRGRGGELSDGTRVYLRGPTDEQAEFWPPSDSRRYPRTRAVKALQPHERATVEAMRAHWRSVGGDQ